MKLIDLPERLFILGTRDSNKTFRVMFFRDTADVQFVMAWDSQELAKPWLEGHEHTSCAAIGKDLFLQKLLSKDRCSIILFNPTVADHIKGNAHFDGKAFPDDRRISLCDFNSVWEYLAQILRKMGASESQLSILGQQAVQDAPHIAPMEIFELATRMLKEPSDEGIGSSAVPQQLDQRPRRRQDGGDRRAGYVYVLINPSTQGLVKVGKTRRAPAERAKELSAATGVATPFTLVYEAFFEDCARAEDLVHALLEKKGYRLSKNKEFFSAPPSEAVNAVLQSQQMLKMSNDALGTVAEGNGIGADIVEGDPTSGDEPWRDVYEMAEAAYSGEGDTIQDVEEALKLFLDAARLGSPEACWRVGLIYAHEENLKDVREAMRHFKEGARRGDVHCYVEMAELFAAGGQFENAHKCWNRFFNSECSPGTRGPAGSRYLFQVKIHGLPLIHKAQLLAARDDILHFCDEEGGFRKFVQYHLYPEIPRDCKTSTIRSFNVDEGVGWITNPDGPDAFLSKDNVLEGNASLLQKGQLVKFELTSDGIACNVVVLA